MNRDDLQLFMTIFEEKNLLKAAVLLYLSPSTCLLYTSPSPRD